MQEYTTLDCNDHVDSCVPTIVVNKADPENWVYGKNGIYFKDVAEIPKKGHDNAIKQKETRKKSHVIKGQKDMEAEKLSDKCV